MKISTYRKIHPKCKYCEHYIRHKPWWDYNGDFVYFYCCAKDKVIKDGHEELPRLFCSLYKAKEY